MPSRSQRFSKRSRTSSGAVENVTMTCSIRFSPTIRSRSQLAPKDREAGHAASMKGLLVEEPDRSQPHLGMLGRVSFAIAARRSPPDDQRALTGVTLLLARRSEAMSQIRPAITNVVARARA